MKCMLWLYLVVGLHVVYSSDNLHAQLQDADTATMTVNLDHFIFTKASRPKMNLPIAGSEPFVFYEHARQKLFLYSQYAVRVFEMEPDGGDSILVYPFSHKRDSTGQVYLVDQEPIFTSSDFGIWFFGILHGFLFLDLGTGPDRGLRIYSLADTPTMAYDGGYSGAIRVVSPDSLTFYESIDREPTVQECPKMKEWRARGREAELQERVVLSLKSMHKRKTGDIRCMPLQ